MHSQTPSPINRRRFLSLLALLVCSTSFPAFAQSKKTPAASDSKSEPNILPYLQNPAPDAMTICFLSTSASDVKVEYFAKKGASPTKVSATALAIPKTTWKIWKARIKGLKPRINYSYRVTYKEGKETQSSDTYTFQTLDWNDRETKAIAFNDVHDKLGVLEALMTHVKPDDYQYSLLLGDMWNDPSPNNNAALVFKTMEGYVRLLNASSKPMFYIRGNHDTRGYFAGQLSYLFDLPNNNPKDKLEDQNAYYEFRSGPVWFISPDSGEDGNKREEIFKPYRQRQATWLKQTFSKSPSRKAPWKVLASHIPLYTPRGWDQPDALNRWLPILDKEKIDLMIAGHDHTPHFVPKGKTFPRKRDKEPQTPPYPVIIGGGPNMGGSEVGTVMFLDASSKTLNVRMMDIKGKVIHSINLRK